MDIYNIINEICLKEIGRKYIDTSSSHSYLMDESLPSFVEVNYMELP